MHKRSVFATPGGLKQEGNKEVLDRKVGVFSKKDPFPQFANW